MSNNLSWNNHSDLTMKKLNKSCYIIRNAKTYVCFIIKSDLLCFFNLVMSYGIIFWEKLSHTSINFRIKKKAIRIMEGCGNRVSCRNLFKKLQIWPLTSQYMLSLLMFVVQNKNLFLTNNENHNLDTRQRNDLYLPQANLTIYQKGAYYSGIKIFNNLPLEIKNVAGKKKKSYETLLHTYLFYTIEEYLSQS